MPKPNVRKGMPSVQLTKEEFSKRARERFYDPTFDAVAPEIEKVIAVAWKNYIEYHRSPREQSYGLVNGHGIDRRRSRRSGRRLCRLL